MYLIRLHSPSGFYYYLTGNFNDLWSEKEDLGGAYKFKDAETAEKCFLKIMEKGYFSSAILGDVSIVTLEEIKKIDFQNIETKSLERMHRLDEFLEELMDSPQGFDSGRFSINDTGERVLVTEDGETATIVFPSEEEDS